MSTLDGTTFPPIRVTIPFSNPIPAVKRKRQPHRLHFGEAFQDMPFANVEMCLASVIRLNSSIKRHGY